ncbi:MAG: Clp protease N-terminal domain-containing protein [Pirellula sp.]
MTQRSHTLVAEATSIATATSLGRLESIHFLIAMTSDQVSIAGLVLKQNGVKRDDLLSVVLDVGREDVEALRDEIFFIATQLGHTYPGPEHFILAICRGQNWNGASALRILGIDPKKIEHDVYEVLGTWPS